MRLAALLALVAGCASGSAGPLVVTPAEYDPLTLQLTDLVDGATLSLQMPPQGGQVVFVGARVRGLASSLVQLTARLVAGDGSEIGVDTRESSFVAEPGNAALMIPDLHSFAGVSNVPVCPGATSASLDGAHTRLTVTVSEAGSGRMGVATLATILRCQQTDASVRARCQCECAPGYTGMCP
jgi:hypothetical protein